MSLTIKKDTVGERYAGLSLLDLDSTVSFKSWLNSVMPSSNVKEISDDELLIYLSYIKERVRESELDSILWLNALSLLEKKVGVKL